MLRKILLLAVVGMFVFAVAAPAQAAVVDAEDSGWIRSDDTDSSGGPNESAAGTTSATNAFRTLVQFDTGSLAPFAATDATLTLYGSDKSPDDLAGVGTAQVWLHAVVGTFEAGQVDWLEASDGDAWTSRGGDFNAEPLDIVEVDLGTFAENDTIEFQSAELTSAVQGAIDAGESLALMVRTPSLEFGQADGRSILWTKGFESDNAPELNVIPEPATMGLLALGGLGLIRRGRK